MVSSPLPPEMEEGREGECRRTDKKTASEMKHERRKVKNKPGRLHSYQSQQTSHIANAPMGEAERNKSAFCFSSALLNCFCTQGM